MAHGRGFLRIVTATGLVASCCHKLHGCLQACCLHALLTVCCSQVVEWLELLPVPSRFTLSWCTDYDWDIHGAIHSLHVHSLHFCVCECVCAWCVRHGACCPWASSHAQGCACSAQAVGHAWACAWQSQQSQQLECCFPGVAQVAL